MLAPEDLSDQTVDQEDEDAPIAGHSYVEMATVSDNPENAPTVAKGTSSERARILQSRSSLVEGLPWQAGEGQRELRVSTPVCFLPAHHKSALTMHLQEQHHSQVPAPDSS